MTIVFSESYECIRNLRAGEMCQIPSVVKPTSLRSGAIFRKSAFFSKVRFLFSCPEHPERVDILAVVTSIPQI